MSFLMCTPQSGLLRDVHGVTQRRKEEGRRQRSICGPRYEQRGAPSLHRCKGEKKAFDQDKTIDLVDWVFGFLLYHQRRKQAVQLAVGVQDIESYE